MTREDSVRDVLIFVRSARRLATCANSTKTRGIFHLMCAKAHRDTSHRRANHAALDARSIDAIPDAKR